MSCQFNPANHALELDLEEEAVSYSVVSNPNDIEGVAVPVASGLHHPLRPIEVKLDPEAASPA